MAGKKPSNAVFGDDVVALMAVGLTGKGVWTTETTSNLRHPAYAKPELLAARLIVETCKRHGIRPETLTIYADRGSPMTATSTALLLANLGDGGIGLMTPWTVQTGRAEAVRNARQDVLNQAFQSHPLRFVCETPQPPAPPNAVWINPPNLKIAA